MSVHLPSAPPAHAAHPAPAPGAAPPPARRPGSGVALLAALAAVAAVVAWSERLPPPLPADAPAGRFAEARALPVLRHLAGGIGDRGIGTAGGDSAVAYLAGLLRAIPGVEVAVQEEVVVAPHVYAPDVTNWYRSQNVLARIPGRERAAVLFSTHYDSPPESVGAGDAAMVVASAVEAIRALAAEGGRPRNTLVFVFVDGEEDGLLGSAAVLRHPWARDARAFANLESAGPGGRALLFQAGPGNAWLARAYARAVPRPYGTVLAQDLFQGGVIPSDTDFRVYRDRARLRGLDLATVRDGYAYHTALDRPGRIPPGTVQHVGGTVLGLARELGAAPLPGDVGGPPAVFYSLLGRGMVVYGAGTARLLAAAALLLAAAAVAVARRRGALTLRGAAGGLAAALLAWVAGLACALLAAIAVGSLLGRPHGWFAHPWLGVAAFGGLALAGAAASRALWLRRGERRGGAAPGGAPAGWAGALALWSAALLGLTVAGVGAAYLALWWVLPAAAALLLAAVLPRRRAGWFIAALVPGALVTAEAGVLLVGFFVPLAGRMGSSSPLDPLIAVLVAAPLLA
ncbi:MAG TPA: M28 family metallopeptidase, partial [Longimicrobium sp.]|nr:M28 family metallopeptidase [Longimicrobium sp.]